MGQSIAIATFLLGFCVFFFFLSVLGLLLIQDDFLTAFLTAVIQETKNENTWFVNTVNPRCCMMSAV